MDRLENEAESASPITQAQTSDEKRATNSQKMEEKRAENEEKDKTEEGLLIAIQGAKIKFNAHLGEFKVLNDVPTTQGKLTGTIVEKQIPNFTFYDGFQMISLTEWQDFGTAKVQDNDVLLKKSFLPSVGKLPGNIPPETGKIEFVDSGQVNVPESIDPKGAPVPAIITVLKKFLVHFRRNISYKGEFGFDWMRDEYIYPITNVGGTNKELSLDPAKLKTEYKTADVSNAVSPYGKDYYCSFLNLMLNQEVSLDLEVEELETLSADATEIVFESSNVDLTITPTTIPLNTLIAGGKQNKNLGGTTRNYYLATNQVKVKCSKAFTKNEQIKVFAKLKDPASGIEDKKEVGKIMVMKNDQIYKLKARFVEVKLKGKLIAKDISLGTENTLDFSAGTSIASMPSAGISNSKSLSLSTTTTNWKSYIENNENDFAHKFSQALIKYEPFKDAKNKIDYKSLKIDFKNFTVGTSSGGTGIDRMKKSITSVDIDALACDMEEFLNGLHEIYATENTPETGIIVFLLPIIIRYSNPPAGLGVNYFDGFSDDIFSAGKYIMMTNYTPSLRKETLVHEAAHTLGLFHSFQTNTTDHGRAVIPDFTFEYSTTENIMDYSVNVLTFWKWQWKKMREDTTDLDLIL